MALATRKQRVRQETLWIAKQELPASAAHPFYAQLNQLLKSEKLDESAEAACQQFYAKTMGRPSLPDRQITPATKAEPALTLAYRSILNPIFTVT